jgi:hypothetical protein
VLAAAEKAQLISARDAYNQFQLNEEHTVFGTHRPPTRFQSTPPEWHTCGTRMYIPAQSPDDFSLPVLHHCYLRALAEAAKQRELSRAQKKMEAERAVRYSCYPVLSTC